MVGVWSQAAATKSGLTNSKTGAVTYQQSLRLRGRGVALLRCARRSESHTTEAPPTRHRYPSKPPVSLPKVGISLLLVGTSSVLHQLHGYLNLKYIHRILCCGGLDNLVIIFISRRSKVLMEATNA